MEYKNCDFNADKVKQYEAVRVAMARIYEHEPAYFGPPEITTLSLGEDDDEGGESIEKRQQRLQLEKSLIKKGYTRIQEKIKDIRQNFATAVTTGSRSGSGKIVMEHYEQLKSSWGGSPSTEPLDFGVNTNSINSSSEISLSEDNSPPVSPSACSSSNLDNEDIDELSDSDRSVSTKRVKARKRPGENPTPKLIDNKRKHLERHLSAAQRDQLLLQEAKEDSQFKKDIAEAIKQSNDTFAKTMQQMSESMNEVAKSFAQSFQMMATTMFPNQASQQQYHEQYHIPPFTAPQPSIPVNRMQNTHPQQFLSYGYGNIQDNCVPGQMVNNKCSSNEIKQTEVTDARYYQTL